MTIKSYVGGLLKFTYYTIKYMLILLKYRSKCTHIIHLFTVKTLKIL